MPYLTENAKWALDERGHKPANSGELNYVITKAVYEYFQRMGGKYAQANDVMGALEGAKAEFYRRVVSPYEDNKIAENGDVYNV